jgi:hypothetical protein
MPDPTYQATGMLCADRNEHVESLLDRLDSHVIDPAEQRANEIAPMKR